MRRLCTAVLLLALAGCNSGSDERKAKRDPLHSYDGRVIRGWLLSLERMDYEQAAYYFAPNALIDQGHPYRLRTNHDAVAFNASLPCRADLIHLKGSGAHVLATFRIRAGPGGPCHGLVKVRYTIRKGKFTAWRQLPNIRPKPAAGREARARPAPPRSAAARPVASRGAAAPRGRA